MSDSRNLVERWRDAGEEKLQDIVNELLTNPRFAETFGQAIQRAGKAKAKVDRNLRVALNLANVPTKADYDDLVRKVVRLGDAVGRLETRLDGIAARLDRLGETLAAKTKRAAR
jgi:hypothetical protein